MLWQKVSQNPSALARANIEQHKPEPGGWRNDGSTSNCLCEIVPLTEFASVGITLACDNCVTFGIAGRIDVVGVGGGNGEFVGGVLGNGSEGRGGGSVEFVGGASAMGSKSGSGGSVKFVGGASAMGSESGGGVLFNGG